MLLAAGKVHQRAERPRRSAGRPEPVVHALRRPGLAADEHAGHPGLGAKGSPTPAGSSVTTRMSMSPIAVAARRRLHELDPTNRIGRGRSTSSSAMGRASPGGGGTGRLLELDRRAEVLHGLAARLRDIDSTDPSSTDLRDPRSARPRSPSSRRTVGAETGNPHHVPKPGRDLARRVSSSAIDPVVASSTFCLTLEARPRRSPRARSERRTQATSSGPRPSPSTTRATAWAFLLAPLPVISSRIAISSKASTMSAFRPIGAW